MKIKYTVVGMRFQGLSDSLLNSIDPGVTLQLKPELNNSVSKNAVAVYFGQTKIGYLKEEHAAEYRRKYYTTSVRAKVERVQQFYIIVAIDDNEFVPAQFNMVKNVIEDYKAEFLNPTKEDSKMNTNNLRDSIFKEVSNVAIDIQSGKLGVITPEGLAVYNSGSVDVNPLTELSVKLPAFAMRVKVEDLKEGDILINGTSISFFKAKTEKGYETIDTKGTVDTVGAVNNLFFGKNTVMAVRNMFSGTGMNPLMLALMLGDNKGFDAKTFALMSMMGNTTGDSNQMLMMALLLGNK